MSKRFLLLIAVVIAVIGGVILLKKDNAGAPEGDSGATTNHTFGENTAVTLVEYGDFECPACGNYFPILKQLKDEYGQEFTFQFRHFPLTQIHQNAYAAHRAAEAAGKQGKFWEMHDLLYQNQRAWSANAGMSQSGAISLFESYAQQLELDMDQYKTDFASTDVNSAINADISAGNELRVSSTPTFFLNGERLENPPSTIQGFLDLIREKQGGQPDEDSGENSDQEETTSQE